MIRVDGVIGRGNLVVHYLSAALILGLVILKHLTGVPFPLNSTAHLDSGVGSAGFNSRSTSLTLEYCSLVIKPSSAVTMSL